MTRAILTVDEGTTGTRAALVDQDGRIGYISYRTLRTFSPEPGVVEQSFEEIWDTTLEVIRDAHAEAARQGVEVVAVAIANQRATAGLWSRRTGTSYGHGMVWQDTRSADELRGLGAKWDERLRTHTGRPAGVRSPYLWAARRLASEPRLQNAHAAGELAFGTVDSWLVWKLSGHRTSVTSATNVAACGGYDLGTGEYFRDWIEALGFPVDVLPPIIDDGGEIAVLDESIVGVPLPIRTVIGDQHGAILGLGCFDAGQSTCIHGTGSFVDQLLTDRLELSVDVPEAVMSTLAWRLGTAVPALENYTAATGSALNWVCREMAMFDEPIDISRWASQEELWAGEVPRFIPALTGVRLPRVDTRVRASISGLDLSTTRSRLALGLLEGIAQSVAMSVDANATVAGARPSGICVGGGLSRSEPLVQMQADLTGVPMLRYPDTDKATLRGAAFLAGRGLFWDTPKEAATTMAAPEVFEPSLPDSRRSEYIERWRAGITDQLSELDSQPATI